MVTSKLSRLSHGKENGYRSGIEELVVAQLAAAGIDARYEEHKFTYVKPVKASTYTPDFILPNGIVVETKGRFVAADRAKHELLKQQHPGLDLRFLFENDEARITKTSKTTYAAWCSKRGFQFARARHSRKTMADVLVPIAWLNEPPEQRRIDAITKAIKK